jgi:hypothetical protein
VQLAQYRQELLSLISTDKLGKGYDNWVMPIGIVMRVAAGYFPHVLNRLSFTPSRTLTIARP